MIQSMHHSVSWWCTIRQLWNCKSKYLINSYPFIIFVAGKVSGVFVNFLYLYTACLEIILRQLL